VLGHALLPTISGQTLSFLGYSVDIIALKCQQCQDVFLEKTLFRGIIVNTTDKMSTKRGSTMAFLTACKLQDPVTIADKLFLDLRRAILEGEIPAGKKISEPELAAAYGVSRGSLREAIGKLENCNLVTRKPNIGARIIGFSTEQMLEIYQIREANEGMAARLAADNMTVEEMVHLRKLLERHQAEITQHQNYSQQDVDLDFHFSIIQGSKNKRLIRMLCQDLYDLVRFYRFRLKSGFNRSEQAFQEHNLIVSAIERRDGEMAETLMRHHIRASRDYARRMLEEMPQAES
jgi:DNA-binding GntR family transcriptional regulator